MTKHQPEAFLYGTELAKLHDLEFGRTAYEAAQIVLKLTPGKPNQQVVDLGCGSGILARILSQNGYRVLGIDISPAMIEIARSKAPAATFVVDSLYTCTMPSSQVICATGESLNYLMNDRPSITDLRDLLKRAAESLLTGGYLIFDILTTKVPQVSPRKLSGDHWSMQLNIRIDRDTSVLTREIDFEIRIDDTVTKGQEVHHQRLFNPNSVRKMLDTLPLKYTVANGYGSLKFRPGQQGFICQKVL